MAPPFFCCAAAHLIFSYPFISYTTAPRRFTPLRRHALISRPFPCARRPPRQFLALRVKSPARRKRRSERQIQGHRPHIQPISAGIHIVSM